MIELVFFMESALNKKYIELLSSVRIEVSHGKTALFMAHISWQTILAKCSVAFTMTVLCKCTDVCACAAGIPCLYLSWDDWLLKGKSM